MATTNYVKFLRGSTAAYQAKVNAGTVDQDTLYFIYESKDAQTGQLYLGTKLLSSGAGAISNASIDDLKDIVITEVGDKQILVYDATEEKWVNSNIYDAIGEMVGATADADGASGLVPSPKLGDENKVLKGDGTWANEFISAIDKNSFKVVNGKLKLADGTDLLDEADRKKLDDLVYDEDGKIAISGTVSAANVEGLQELLDEKADAKDLEDSNDRIQALEDAVNGVNVKDEEGNDVVDDDGNPVVELLGLITRVGNLEDFLKNDKLDEDGNVVEEGLVSKLERLDEQLNGKVEEDEDGNEVKVEGLVDKVNNLDEVIGDVSELIDVRDNEDKEEKLTLVQSINNIYNMLLWGELDELEEEEP